MLRLGHGQSLSAVKGLFHETLDSHLPDKICFAFIDCDLQKSVALCLEKIWPKLVEDGVIIVDDYLSLLPSTQELKMRCLAFLSSIPPTPRPIRFIAFIKSNRVLLILSI